LPRQKDDRRRKAEREQGKLERRQRRQAGRVAQALHQPEEHVAERWVVRVDRGVAGDQAPLAERPLTSVVPGESRKTNAEAMVKASASQV
jgi:hypothetical protein